MCDDHLEAVIDTEAATATTTATTATAATTAAAAATKTASQIKLRISFASLHVIFVHNKSIIATAIRGLWWMKITMANSGLC